MRIRSGAAILSTTAVLIISSCSTPASVDDGGASGQKGAAASSLLSGRVAASSTAGNLTAIAPVAGRRAINWSIVLAPVVSSSGVPSTVVFRGAKSADANWTTAGVDIPTNVVAGDRLVLVATHNHTGATVSGPAGWTLRDSVSSTTATMQSRVWTKTATAADAGTRVAVSNSVSAKTSLQVLAYGNSAGVTALANVVETANTNRHTTPNVPVAVAGSTLLSYWSEKTSTTTGWTLPSGVTQRAIIKGSGSGLISSVSGESLIATPVARPIPETTTTAPVARPIPTTPTTAPPTTAPPTTAPPAIPTPGSFPGDVAPGFVRWGAAIDGNADPVARHESIAGVAMGLRRTFYTWNQSSMITTARNDVAAGRVPWVSTKTPGWAAVAAGTHDAELDSMLRALGALNGPVWFTVHHEPENDDFTSGAAAGGAPAWRAMQAHVRERIEATGVGDNVAFAPILMSWTFDSRSGRNVNDWWVPGIWDFAGIDHYSESAANTTVDLTMWKNARAFYKSQGLKVAIGEWGNRGSDAESAREMQDFYNLALASGSSSQAQVVGMSYFDSGLNTANGSWELLGDQLDKFRALMNAPTSLPASRNGG